VVQTFTVAKLTPLLILAIAGMFAINWNNLAWPGMPTGSEIARTTVLLIFAFTGVESALTPSGEVKNPARTVPRSILIALVSVTILYMILQVVAQGILGAELATNTKAPLAEAARRSIGDIGQKLVLIGMAISTFGYVAGDMLASPRSIYALGRDNLIPSVVGSVHEKYRTPHVAIVVHAIACAGFAISGSFASLAVLAVLSVLIVYLVCCLATIQLRRKNVRTEGALPFSVPGGPIIPLLAVAMLIWLMSSSTKQEFIAIGAMLAAEVVLYFIMRLRRVPVPVVS
jgi:amino acid transporter